MKALVIGSGEFRCPPDVSKRVVIACDGGLDHCRRAGIEPDHILGDFDSVSPETLAFFGDREKKQYPARKDMTDLELGIRLAAELGAGDITITGALSSSRFDHSLCNIQMLLICMEKGISARIINPKNTVMLAEAGKKHIVKNERRYLSLLPFTDSVEGIVLEGFEYPLNGYTLKKGSSFCVSNEIKEGNGIISFDSGVLIIIASDD